MKTHYDSICIPGNLRYSYSWSSIQASNGKLLHGITHHSSQCWDFVIPVRCCRLLTKQPVCGSCFILLRDDCWKACIFLGCSPVNGMALDQNQIQYPSFTEWCQYGLRRFGSHVSFMFVKWWIKLKHAKTQFCESETCTVSFFDHADQQ